MNQPVQGKNSLGKQRGVIEEETHHDFYFLPSLKNLPNIKERGIEKVHSNRAQAGTRWKPQI
jgi:hypothetical protein